MKAKGGGGLLSSQEKSANDRPSQMSPLKSASTNTDQWSGGSIVSMQREKTDEDKLAPMMLT